MNRLIIIGNGFDLAHGLSTSYKDFIEWYWNKHRKTLYSSSNQKEEDPLCVFKLRADSHIGELWELRELYPHYFDTATPSFDFINAIKAGELPCTFEFKSDLFHAICDSCRLNKWVDIENIFYELLCQKASQLESPDSVNEDMHFIKDKLIEYLKEIQNGIHTDITQKEIQDMLFEPIKNQDVAVSSMDSWNSMLKQRG